MSRSTRSKYEFRQEASLSQQLSNLEPDFRRFSGCDTRTSLKIARLEIFIKYGMLNAGDPRVKMFMELLDAERKVKFATSETVHEITKMGLMMPKSENIVFGSEEE